ncbi:type II secretion system major pseudopilin GspG [Kordiimonas sp. SCSIO 12603]|nr:type II secretion system major pseudopilin GspG [Kordiimonas sp. SCSIO 12603]
MMTMLKALKKNSHKDDGFSLIELMVVIVIIGLLTTVIVVNVLPAQDRGLVTKAQVDITELEKALEMYRLETLRYPSLEDGLEALTKAPGGNSLRQEPFIKNLKKDPWGNDYVYLIPGENGAFDIMSYGADGRPGGEGLNADISNRAQPE